MVKTPAIYRLSPIYRLGKKKTSAENAQEERLEAHAWFDAEYDSVWNTSAPEEPSVPALAPSVSASLPVPAIAPAASASLGSFSWTSWQV
jgi:hypothetical protein